MKNKLRCNLLDVFKKYLKNNDDIVIDMTNLSFDNDDKNSVVKFIKLARNNKYFIKAIILDVKFETILKRNEERRLTGKFIPIDILKSMQCKFDKLKMNNYEIIQNYVDMITIVFKLHYDIITL
jgi:predicted kinase